MVVVDVDDDAVVVVAAAATSTAAVLVVVVPAPIGHNCIQNISNVCCIITLITACRNARLKKPITRYILLWCGIEHSVNIPLKEPHLSER